MFKTDNIILKETLYILVCTLVLSFFMQIAFVVAGRWDYTVLTGNLLGAGTMVLNFFLMCLGVKKAVDKEEKEAKKILKISHTFRSFLMFILFVIGVAIPVFSTLATIIPIVFPRIAIFLRPLSDKKTSEKGVSK